MQAYQTLWALEFKARPPSEYEGLRQQVRQDLERIRQRNIEDRREWYQTLEDGYKLANDQKQADWADEQLQRRFPSAGEFPEMTKWLKDHPWPAIDASPITRRAFYSDLLVQTSQWSQEHAKEILRSFFFLRYRLQAMQQLDDIPATEVEKAVDQMLKFAGENMGDGPWADDYSFAAGILSAKHLAPQRVVGMAQKALAILEMESKGPVSDLYASKDNPNNAFYGSYSRLQLLGYEIDGDLQLKQADKSELLLAQMDQWLQHFKSLAGGDKGREQAYANLRANYWGLRAQEAQLRGHPLDAMAFYEKALLTRLDAQVKPPTGGKDELTDNARRLWISEGGTEHGWQLWYERPANDLANQVTLHWEKTNQPLPAFELADLSGRAWNLASLKGKVTLINFWASWCGPCREELPHLAKLIDQNKRRSDLQFITLNIDENPGLIQSFLDEHQLSMIVIPASNYATEALKVQGIPQNWIVDGQGIVRLKSIGYDSTEQWARAVEKAILNVEAPAAVPPDAAR